MDISRDCGLSEVPDGWRTTDTAVYGWVLEQGRLDEPAVAAALGLPEEEVREALARLIASRLVRRDPQDPVQGFAVSPDVARTELAAPVRSRIRRVEEELDRAQRELDRFSVEYLRHAKRGNGQFRLIANMLEVRVALTQASERCTEEVLSSQPGGGSRVVEAMGEALARDRAILERGVRMRTLYHHTARFNGPSQAYVAAASEFGAQYRTAHELFGRLIVFDRELAFIPLNDGSRGAVAISEPSVASYLADVFEQTWTHATPFADAASQGLGEVAQEIDRTILRLLAAGLKDEAIARRLGMSLRTARRHIADIMEQLGAESRFQAGVAAVQRGLLDAEELLAPAAPGPDPAGPDSAGADAAGAGA
ncbi:LuxR C-terminal-related transcriptional regulator [Streptomyces sp. NPDC049949]|uniref:helix-turn-helix transcriptional regulator n=1 Tax=Streptomyces sp. NPDC049949 TaxID=3154627 RepID=UPI003437FB6A